MNYDSLLRQKPENIKSDHKRINITTCSPNQVLRNITQDDKPKATMYFCDFREQMQVKSFGNIYWHAQQCEYGRH